MGYAIQGQGHFQHVIGVIAFIGQHRIDFESLYQGLRMRYIADLSTAEQTPGSHH